MTLPTCAPSFSRKPTLACIDDLGHDSPCSIWLSISAMASQVAKEGGLSSFGLHPFHGPCRLFGVLKGIMHPLAGQPLQLLPRDIANVPEVRAKESFHGNVDAPLHAVVGCLPCSFHHRIYVPWVACKFPAFAAIAMRVSIPFPRQPSVELYCPRWFWICC